MLEIKKKQFLNVITVFLLFTEITLSAENSHLQIYMISESSLICITFYVYPPHAM